MNLIQSESFAFIFPDDMDAFRKKHDVEIICVDLDEGVVLGIGPNDNDWREIPSDPIVGGAVVKLRSRE